MNWTDFAIKLRKAYGRELYEVSKAHNIPQHWLAGIIADENPSLLLKDSRFEKHLYEGLLKAKAGGAPFWGSWTAGKLAGYDDQALRQLASSWGLGQILGLHHPGLGVSLKELVNAPARMQLELLAKLLRGMANKYINAGDYESTLRIWNTGRPDGKTATTWYVPRATEASECYKQLLIEHPAMEDFLRAHP